MWISKREYDRLRREHDMAVQADAECEAALVRAYERDQRRRERVVFWQKATAKSENRAADALMARDRVIVQRDELLTVVEDYRRQLDEARAEIGRMRDGILHLAEYYQRCDEIRREQDDIYTNAEVASIYASFAVGLRRILDPTPTEPASDLAPPPAAHTCGLGDSCALRAVGVDPERLDQATHSRDTYAQRQAANTRLAHVEARAVQRDVDARLSTQALPCGCLPGYECRCEVKA